MDDIYKRICYYKELVGFPDDVKLVCRDLKIKLHLMDNLISASYARDGAIYIGTTLDVPDYRDVIFHELQHALFHFKVQDGDMEQKIKKPD